jgi:hypothetical protein
MPCVTRFLKAFVGTAGWALPWISLSVQVTWPVQRPEGLSSEKAGVLKHVHPLDVFLLIGARQGTKTQGNKAINQDRKLPFTAGAYLGSFRRDDHLQSPAPSLALRSPPKPPRAQTAQRHLGVLCAYLAALARNPPDSGLAGKRSPVAKIFLPPRAQALTRIANAASFGASIKLDRSGRLHRRSIGCLKTEQFSTKLDTFSFFDVRRSAART